MSWNPPRNRCHPPNSVANSASPAFTNTGPTFQCARAQLATISAPTIAGDQRQHDELPVPAAAARRIVAHRYFRAAWLASLVFWVCLISTFSPSSLGPQHPEPPQHPPVLPKDSRNIAKEPLFRLLFVFHIIAFH